MWGATGGGLAGRGCGLGARLRGGGACGEPWALRTPEMALRGVGTEGACAGGPGEEGVKGLGAAP